MSFYEHRYVAFLDILGFKSVVSQTESDDKLLEKLVSAINRILDTRNGADIWGFDVTTFSDCIIISSLQHPCLLIPALQTLFSDLAQLGIYLRGGISSGKTHHRENVVFGTGVNKAYELESKIAVHPRIVVATSVAAELGDSSKWVLKSEDGPHFIDGFYEVRYEHISHLNKHIIEETKEKAKLIREQLQKNLDKSRDDPRIFSKIKWLSNQFNDAMTMRIAGVPTGYWVPPINLN